MRMSLIDFGTLTHDFYEYMGRDKKPTNERLALWFQKLKKIKMTEAIEAYEYMKDSMDSLPYNIPKALKMAVFMINKDKEQPTIEYGAYGACDDCNGTGIFKLRIFSKTGRWSEPIKFCSRCENWRNWTGDPGTRVSKAELEALEIMHKPYNQVFKYSKPVDTPATMENFENLALEISEDKRMRG